MLFWQLFSSYMYVEKAAKMRLVQKICTYNVDEIDGRLYVLKQSKTHTMQFDCVVKEIRKEKEKFEAHCEKCTSAFS